MIQGLGTDIIEIDRIATSIDRHGKKFLDRLFTSQEQEYCKKFREPARHFAGRFAAKEAIVKALGTGFGEKIGWLDIEIVSHKSGKPMVSLSPQVLKEFNSPRVMVSISHSKDYANAVAIVENE